MKTTIGNAVALAALLIAVIFALDFRAYPYADDWAYFTPMALDWAETLRWIFAQHVDHYIPIQKAFHSWVAHSTQYDFRVLLLTNLLLAYLAALCMLGAARSYRGSAHWGDVIIPLGVLNLALAYTNWAFQFQFLSSVFFASLFVYLFTRYGRGHEDGQRLSLYGALSSLTLLALCGMNGAVSAFVILAGLPLWYLIGGKKTLRPGLVGLALYLLAVAVVGWVILSWKPSGASQTGFAAADAAKIFFYLQTASLGAGAKGHFGMVGPLSILLLIALVTWRLIFKLRKGVLSNSDVVIFVVLLATEAVLLSVALGRAAMQGGWSGVIAMHYGPLGVLAPLLLWLLVSQLFSRRAVTVAAVGYIAVYAFAYVDGLQWRAQHQEQVQVRQDQVTVALKTDPDIDGLVNRHALELTWKDEAEYKTGIVDVLKRLRASGAPLYSLLPPFSVKAVDLSSSVGLGDMVTILQLTEPAEWREGGDFGQTAIDGHAVYGSYIHGDVDKGSLGLQMRRGQSVIVRTGPELKNQSVRVIVAGTETAFTLPASHGYSLLTFDSPSLPEEFRVIFQDDGDGFGEWSSVVLRR